jgi:hypothetical protein
VAHSKPFIESQQPLWIIPGPLMIWATHFMLCYVTAALWCGKVGPGPLAPLGGARVAIGAYTAVALAAILGIGWSGYRAQAFGGSTPPHDADSPADRYRFVGHATLLIAGLAAVAVIYSAMAAVFVETCQ